MSDDLEVAAARLAHARALLEEHRARVFGSGAPSWKSARILEQLEQTVFSFEQSLARLEDAWIAEADHRTKRILTSD